MTLDYVKLVGTFEQNTAVDSFLDGAVRNFGAAITSTDSFMARFQQARFQANFVVGQSAFSQIEKAIAKNLPATQEVLDRVRILSRT